MCGILGIISQNNDININNLESIKNVLNHRGPDASNYFIQKNIFLLHNRLSIIDLMRDQINHYLIIKKIYVLFLMEKFIIT